MIQPIISSASSSKEASWEALALVCCKCFAIQGSFRLNISCKNQMAINSVIEISQMKMWMLKEKDSTSLPIIPTVNVTQRQNSKGTQSQRSFQGHTTGDCRKLAKFLRENNISFTYADYGGPDEIFLGDGNSHPISHTGLDDVPIKTPLSPLQPMIHSSLPHQSLYLRHYTFQEQTPDIFEEEHTPHTIQGKLPNTFDQQHTHSPPVTSQSPGPHATTSQSH
ncbi:hypothetical protein Tco_1110826 [Tanacetum coccineum]|uniref:Uncharacterized protein n=1 Tax=Tanacetum coccineum TaxID=301880 RepID=A0ABQ5IJX9_9ASTR